MNLRIPCLFLFCALSALPLRAQDSSSSTAETNAPSNSILLEPTNQAAAIPSHPPGVRPIPSTANETPSVNSVHPTTDAPRDQSPAIENNSAAAEGGRLRYLVRPDESLIWVALGGVLVVSLSAMVFCWQMSRRHLAVAPLPPRAEAPALIAPTLLPVISQAIKEALVQELSAQRHELLSAQQSAAAELSQLARRLEAVQTPLLERLNGLRPPALPPAKFSREIPVKVFCGCGQKYAFEVQPVDGHMPFPVACPACGQDGTHQANQVIMRLLNGITQPLSPNGGSFLKASPTSITPQLVEAVKQAVVNELAAKRVEVPKPIAVVTVPEHKNGSLGNHVEKPLENVLPKLLAEGQSLADAGELDQAVKCLEAALALQPERAETFVKLAGVFEKLDRSDDALLHYDRAIALDDSLTIAYLNKGGVFNRLARYDEALRCYEQALLKQKKTVA